MIEQFHFLRPYWFMALLPLAVILWLLWRQRLASRSWRQIVDKQLLDHLLIGEGHVRHPWVLMVIAVAALLAITALAGPVWRQIEQPVFRYQSALVVLLDLSRSMDATDVKPSRLERARLKLRDILRQRSEGETALIVFAADPFVVSPLTSDARTIDSQIPSLVTTLMPAQGSRLDRAINRAEQLLRQAGMANGLVLLIGDDVGVGEKANAAVKRLTDAGYRFSVLGVGTEEGAPIPLAGGGFVKERGTIVLPRLERRELSRLAQLGNGHYRDLGTDDQDIQVLLASLPASGSDLDKAEEDTRSDQWHEEGPWLLLPLMLLALLAFRRGYLLIALAIIPLSRPAQALDWSSLWLRDDQRAARMMEQQQPSEAAKLFTDPHWRAAASYRAGDYDAAVDALTGFNDATSWYNRGNALAQTGQWPAAINAYDQALERNPALEDAQHNRDLLEKLLEQQQAQQGEPGEGEPGEGEPGETDQQSAQHAHGEDGEGEQLSQHSQQSGEEGEEITQSRSDQETEEGETGEVMKPEETPEGDETTQASTTDQLPDEQSSDESTVAIEQWLRRVPDDPGGLWRRKFLYQYQRQDRRQRGQEQPW